MRYAITGGAGFIGINFADRLAELGHEVILVDNLSRPSVTKNIEWLTGKHGDKIELIYADVRNDQRKLDMIANSVDVIYHLAGQVAVTTSVVDPREDFDINALGTFNILEAIRKSEKNPILIYSSTNKVYGGMEDATVVEQETRYTYKDLPLGVPETRSLDFHSPYGCSKGAADQYVRDYARIYGLRTVVMRQSCIYGTRQFGVEDQGWVAWFTIASSIKKPITIFGDGKQVRDVLFVDDLFNVFEAAVNNIETVSGEVFNIGGGIKHSMSLLELLSMLENNLGRKIEYSFSDWRPGDQPVFISDITKAKNMLDWQPQINVQEGVDKLSSWVAKNIKLFNL